MANRAQRSPIDAYLRAAVEYGKVCPNTGLLFARRLAEQALWVDLLRGDELGTAGSADPAKVQQFLVTFLLATIYLASLWGQLVPPTAAHLFKTLPNISNGGLILLSVSHAAYLGAKAVPQTPGGPDTSTIPHIDTTPQVSARVPPPPRDPPVTVERPH